MTLALFFASADDANRIARDVGGPRNPDRSAEHALALANEELHAMRRERGEQASSS